MPRVLGWRWRCASLRGYLCDSGTTKPTRDRCGWCRGSLVVERGLWGVFRWTEANRYPAEAALGLYRSHGHAEQATERRYPENVVVRFVREADLDG